MKSRKKKLPLRLKRRWWAPALYVLITLISYWSTSSTRIIDQLYALESLPPEILKVSGPSSLHPKEVGVWSIYAFDPDGEKLVYSAIWNKKIVDTLGRGGVTPATSSNDLSFAFPEPGNYIVQFAATDQTGESDYLGRTISVE